MSKQKKFLAVFGGCATTMLICAVIVVLLNPVKLAMSAAGFDSQEDTDVYLEDTTTEQVGNPIDWSGLGDSDLVVAGEGQTGNDAAPTTGDATVAETEQIVPDTVSSVEEVTVNLEGNQGVINLENYHADRVEQGKTTTGKVAYYVEYDEEGANELADDLFWKYAPQEAKDQMRNPRVELKNGAMIIYAEANLGVGWQEVGLVMRLTSSGKQFEVVGIDIGGSLYTNPPVEFIADLMETVETEGNEALANAEIVTPSGNLSVQQIYITEDTLQLIAK